MKKQYWMIGLIAAMFAAGCGGSKEALYTKGPMPPEGNFDGVYQSDFGRLELSVEGGDKVVGLYEKNDIYGRIEGKINNNLLFFTWTQWNVELRGKIRETKGRGVFQYILDQPQGENGKPHHWLNGFWAYAKEEPTNPWKAYKLGAKAKKKLVQFDPDSYTGNEEEEEDNAGGFAAGDGSSSAPASSGGDDAELF
jgi:hypothetical protein